MTPPNFSSHTIDVLSRPQSLSALHPDFWVGVFFAGVGAVVWQQGAVLRQGTAASMGPGFVPFWLGVALVLVGGAIALLALRRQAETESEEEGGFNAIQPIAVTTAALLVFSLSLDSWGLFIASGLLVAVARFDSWIRHPLEIVALASLLAAVNIAIFRYGLSVPVPVWPV